MKKKNIMVVGVILVAVLTLVGCQKIDESYLEHDGTTGTAEFTKLTAESGFGADIDKGEFPLDITLEEGELNIKISKGDDVVFEETGIDESKTLVADISEDGFYMVTLSGKKATGTIRYPVSSSENTPEINGATLEQSVDGDIVK